MDVIFAGTKKEYRVVSKYCRASELFYGVGVDFSKYYNDKIEARKRLNISLDKKILLYVGRFVKHKGVQYSIAAYNKLKNQYDCDLYLIGGYKGDELYDDCITSGQLWASS